MHNQLQPQPLDRRVMLSQNIVGHEVASFRLKDLQAIDGELFFETASKNTYVISKTPDGKLVLIDSRRNQGKGQAVRGIVLGQKDIDKLTIVLDRPFTFEGGRTSDIEKITFVNKNEKRPDAPDKDPIPPYSDVRTRLRNILDPIRGHQLDYKALGMGFSLNEQDPPKPGDYILPYNDAYDDDDEPTLAGKIILRLYPELVNRDNLPPKKNEENGQDRGLAELKNYFNYAKELLIKRTKQGKNEIGLGNKRVTETDQFYYDTPASVFSMYFNKSHTHWKNPRAAHIRAYITLSPEQGVNLYKNYVDLNLALYDAGIDFSSKCVSPYGLDSRTENIVLYIAEADQSKASTIIKEFMTSHKLGQGHVKAALPSPQDGLRGRHL